MNLFVAGWNAPRQCHATALTALGRMIEVYPQLDPGTLQHHSCPRGTVFVASMHTADQAALPRSYVAQTDEQIVLYDGLPVESTGSFSGHRAEALAAHWNQLAGNLDGHYVILRAGIEPPFLEVITDLLGVQPAFYFHRGGTWLISNSVQLIERIAGPSELDPLGVSTFLTFGWAGADRTLRRCIRVIRGGQQWIWHQGKLEPEKRAYCDASLLACQPRQELSASYFRQVAEDLTRPCRSLSRDFELIRCALTGGRDSRLLMALLSRAGLPTQYWTGGEPLSADVKTAALIAKTRRLSHSVVPVPGSDVVAQWDDLCWKLIQRNDGMSSLWHIGDLLAVPDHIDRLEMNLWGVGGELARGFSTGPAFFLGRHDVMGIRRFLSKSFVKDRGGLVRREACVLAEEHISRCVSQYIAEGVAPADVPDVFYMYERISRFVGGNVRKVTPIGDLFAPFCSRRFIEAIFSVSALQRCTEPLHYGMLRVLAPDLHGLPYAKDTSRYRKSSWRCQDPVVNLLGMVGYQVWRNARQSARRRVPIAVRQKLRPRSRRPAPAPVMYGRWRWLEAKLEQIRTLCLDQPGSVLWDFVDRSVFERMTSPSTAPTARRSGYLGGLYITATLFCYEALHSYSDTTIEG